MWYDISVGLATNADLKLSYEVLLEFLIEIVKIGFVGETFRIFEQSLNYRQETNFKPPKSSGIGYV
jgi:hypothetical protein